ncbi:MAG: PHP-associated domain-containing protein [Thermoplasmatales archaeon]|nr:PHP-associated domain-containing protein [Thermoplasmatales archaeon]
MKIDLHVHSCYSDDADGSVKELIKAAVKKGLNGIAIADHNSVEGGLKGFGIAKEMKDFAVIPGVEVSSANGHIIGLNVKENIPKKLTAEETVERINSLGGMPVLPHPYRMLSGIGEKNVKGFAGVEVFNSRSPVRENKKAEKLAKKMGIGETGGSDAHSSNEVGYGITEFSVNSFRIDDLLQEIVKKRTKGYGVLTPKKIALMHHVKSLRLWFKRGWV